MDISSGYSRTIRRIWAELLTIRHIAADGALWRAAAFLFGQASKSHHLAACDPFIKAIVAQRGSDAADPEIARGTAPRTGCTDSAGRTAEPHGPRAGRRKTLRDRPGPMGACRSASSPSRRSRR
jgi:hypothetical protein